MTEHEVRSRGVPTPPVHESDTATKVLTPRTLERELKDRDNGNPCCAYPANLFIAKMLFFCTSMSNVGWNRFQTLFFIQKGLSSVQIGMLKSFGLVLKMVGEPLWCIIADMTDDKIIFAFSLLMNIVTMEILRLAQPLTFSIICCVKLLRTTTAPGNTLMTTASFKLTEGSSEGYGQQRMFGSLAWGVGALVVGYLIDSFGMDSIFFFTYPFFLISFVLVITYLPSSEPRIIISKSQSRGELDLSVSDDMDGSSHSTASWHGLKDATSAARYALNASNNITKSSSSDSDHSDEMDIEAMTHGMAEEQGKQTTHGDSREVELTVVHSSDAYDKYSNDKYGNISNSDNSCIIDENCYVHVMDGGNNEKKQPSAFGGSDIEKCNGDEIVMQGGINIEVDDDGDDDENDDSNAENPLLPQGIDERKVLRSSLSSSTAATNCATVEDLPAIHGRDQVVTERMRVNSRSQTSHKRSVKWKDNHHKHVSGRRHRKEITIASLLKPIIDFFSKYRHFFRSLSCRILCLNIFVYGCVMVVLETYFYISLEKEFHSSRTLNGLCTSVSTIACLPIFWYSESLIKKHGHHKMITVSQVLCCIRLLMYTLVKPSTPNAELVLLSLQFIHGVNFALFWSASVDAIFKLAPPELENSCMATLNMIYHTLAGIVGNVFFGYLFDYGGSDLVYLSSAGVLALSIAVFTLYQERVEAELDDIIVVGARSVQTNARQI